MASTLGGPRSPIWKRQGQLCLSIASERGSLRQHVDLYVSHHRRIDMLMLPYRSLGAALILASVSLPSATTAHSQTTGTAESRIDTRVEAATQKSQDGCGADVKTCHSNVTSG